MQVLNSDFLKFRISEILIGVLVCIGVCLSLPHGAMGWSDL